MSTLFNFVNSNSTIVDASTEKRRLESTKSDPPLNADVYDASSSPLPTWKAIGLSSILFCGLFLLLAGVPLLMRVVYVALVFWALRGPFYVLQALVLAACLRYLNPAVFTFYPEMGLVTWLVLLVGFFRALPLCSGEALIRLRPLLAFFLVVTLLTISFSGYPAVSMMKLISFTLGASTVLICCQALSKTEIETLWRWMLGLFFALIFLSLLTVSSPSVAYQRGAGFQGILNHPQALGALIAPFATYLFAEVFFQKRAIGSGVFVVAMALIGLSVFSETRTSTVAVALSLLCCALLYFSRIRRYSSGNTAGKVLGKSALFFMLFIVAIATVQPLQNIVAGYVLKRESANLEQAFSSRSGGIESQWHNFLAQPVQGWGFGIYPGDDFAKDVHTIWGIPISAPVEKGFLPPLLTTICSSIKRSSTFPRPERKSRKVWTGYIPPKRIHFPKKKYFLLSVNALVSGDARNNNSRNAKGSPSRYSSASHRRTQSEFISRLSSAQLN
jgi:hypothetical protein